MPMESPQQSDRWPNGARAAISMTMDNMGEAADLNRGLWPSSEPIGSHYSVTKVLPKMLALLKKYSIPATYYIESWNLNVYEDTIVNDVAGAGLEVAWHAWQHEAWGKLENVADERANFERSFGDEGMGRMCKEKKLKNYRGFRPPGGLIHGENGERTLALCRENGLTYISPAAEKAALVKWGEKDDHLVVLPFKWRTVDAYYYMDTFSKLREIKGELPAEPQSPSVLAERYIREVDKAIEEGGFVSLLFHPFLTDSDKRLEAMETVLKHLQKKSQEGEAWVARCCEVADYVHQNPSVVGPDPEWDTTSWR